MPLKMEPLEEPNLILTPVIDIMLLLLIFFMVATEFADEEKHLEISLPTSSDAAALTSLPDPATVNVTAAGEVFLQGESVGVPDLERQLAEMRENYPGQAVLIRGDGTAAYQRIMDVLAAVKRAGIASVSLASRQEPQE